MIKSVKIVTAATSAKPSFSFRNIHELIRTLDEIKDTIKSGETLAEGLQKALAARVITINVNDGGVSLKGAKKSKGKESSDKVDVKKMSSATTKKIQDNFKKLNTLLEKSDAIAQIEAQLTYQFRNDPAYSATKKEIAALKAQLQKNLKSMYAVVEKVASDNLPQKVVSNTKKLFDNIEDEMDNYDKSERKVIVDTFQEDGYLNIRYTAYLCLSGLTDDSGHIYNSYFIVLTTIIKESGAVSYYVVTTTQFKAPGNFNAGVNVTSLSEAREAVEDMLRSENFTNVVENIPFPLSKKDIDPDAFGSLVTKFDVAEDHLKFVINRPLKDDAKEKLVKELFLLVKGLIATKTKGNVKFKVKPSGKNTEIYFYYTLPAGTSLSMDKHKFKHMQDIFNLSDDEIKKIQQVLV